MGQLCLGLGRPAQAKIALLTFCVAWFVALSLGGASPSFAGKAKALAESSFKVYVHWGLKQVAAANLPGFCWRKSYGRGVGRPLSTCRDGETKSGALCYPNCKDGYYAVGPVCWQRCPAGFRNDGAFCGKPAPYGRGVGYPWKFGDSLNLNAAKQRCQNANAQGCEQWGLIIYPKCKPGYHPAGCCVCSPDCPTGSGMTDIGVSCAKKSYGNGWGTTLKCKPGEDEDAALCYDRCKSGYSGVGPVCWQQCPEGMVNCGAGCAAASTGCGASVGEMVVAPLEMVASIAGLVVTAGGSAAATSAVKTAAKTGVKASVKAAIKKFAQDHIKESVRKSIYSKLAAKLAPDVAEGVVTGVAETLAVAGLSVAEPEAKDILVSLDPTGIAGVVDTFNQDTCPLPSAVPDVPETVAGSVEDVPESAEETLRRQIEKAQDVAALPQAKSTKYRLDNSPCGLTHGVLFKFRGDYYGVDGGSKRKFASSAAREKCKLTETSFVSLADDRLACYVSLRTGVDISTESTCGWNPFGTLDSDDSSLTALRYTCELPENMLYTLPGSSQTWYLKDGKRRRVASERVRDECFTTNIPGRVKAIPIGPGQEHTVSCFEDLPEGTAVDLVDDRCDLNDIPANCDLKTADTLIQGNNNDPLVYALTAGKKRFITDWPSFQKCGFELANIVKQPPTCVSRIPSGPNISNFDGSCDLDAVPKVCNGVLKGVYFTQSTDSTLYYFDGNAKRKVNRDIASECGIERNQILIFPNTKCAASLPDGIAIDAKVQCPSRATGIGMDALAAQTDAANASHSSGGAPDSNSTSTTEEVPMPPSCRTNWNTAVGSGTTLTVANALVYHSVPPSRDTNHDGLIDFSEWAVACSEGETSMP